MAAILDPKFCVRCGGPMGWSVPPGERRERHVCVKCGFVHYLDPKVACGTVPEIDGRCALILRNMEPRKGYWSFPCGFMEVNETSAECAVRETLEETGLEVECGPLLGTYSHIDSFFGGSIVVVVYAGRVVGGTLRAGDDACDARMVRPGEIPWKDLAFKSSASALLDWLRWKGIDPPPGGGLESPASCSK